MRVGSILVLIFCCLNIGTFAWDDNDVEAIRAKLVANARYDLPAEFDYIDEIIHGHRTKDKDKDKHRRQAGCMCVEHFIDPHCGSDSKTYDNGCFFMCAQKRDPGLRLKRWGDCTPKTEYREI